MTELINNLSIKYFKEICKLIKEKNLQVVIIIHILPDIKQMLEALKQVVDIPLMIAIPYSIHTDTLNHLKKRFKIICPTLEQISDGNYLEEQILNNISHKKKTVILEIGGYCSSAVENIKKQLGHNFLGIIEDTEAGHRRYEILEQESTLPCPIVSIARSSLKSPEDFLVGTSCLFSTEKILRQAGFSSKKKLSLVLGFGKICRGMAYDLRQNKNPVCVYDSDPIKNIHALSEGFQVYPREISIRKSEIIYGTTGYCSLTKDDFISLKNNIILISCSSKQLEFDINSLNSEYRKEKLKKHIDLYENNKQKIYLLADGKPVNFANSVMIGPLLMMVLAEMILAINTILTYKNVPKIIEVSYENKKIIANEWLQYFRNEETGRY